MIEEEWDGAQADAAETVPQYDALTAIALAPHQQTPALSHNLAYDHQRTQSAGDLKGSLSNRKRKHHTLSLEDQDNHTCVTRDSHSDKLFSTWQHHPSYNLEEQLLTEVAVTNLRTIHYKEFLSNIKILLMAQNFSAVNKILSRLEERNQQKHYTSTQAQYTCSPPPIKRSRREQRCQEELAATQHQSIFSRYSSHKEILGAYSNLSYRPQYE